VMPELMGIKHIVVLNDGARHCDREKPQHNELDVLKGENKDEAKKNNAAARVDLGHRDRQS
jgi:type III restriction enzyme